MDHATCTAAGAPASILAARPSTSTIPDGEPEPEPSSSIPLAISALFPAKRGGCIATPVVAFTSSDGRRPFVIAADAAAAAPTAAAACSFSCIATLGTDDELPLLLAAAVAPPERERFEPAPDLEPFIAIAFPAASLRSSA